MPCFICFCNGTSIVCRAGGGAEEGWILARSTGVCVWLVSTLHANAMAVASMHGGNVARASAVHGERGMVFSAPDAICSNFLAVAALSDFARVNGGVNGVETSRPFD